LAEKFQSNFLPNNKWQDNDRNSQIAKESDSEKKRNRGNLPSKKKDDHATICFRWIFSKCKLQIIKVMTVQIQLKILSNEGYFQVEDEYTS